MVVNPHPSSVVLLDDIGDNNKHVESYKQKIRLRESALWASLLVSTFQSSVHFTDTFVDGMKETWTFQSSVYFTDTFVDGMKETPTSNSLSLQVLGFFFPSSILSALAH